jgi:hypothetical protein
MGKNIIFLGLTIIGGIIFTIQNSEPTTIIILNQPIPLKLPLAWWILLSILAGIVTSLILQLSNQLSAGSNQSRFSSRSPQPDSPKSPRDLPQKSSKPEFQDSKEEDDDEWNIEEPPQTTPERIESEWSAQQREKANEIEEEAPFQAPSRSSAIYSYRYQESQKKQPQNPNPDQEVYDVEYRVITPPYQDPPSEDPDHEDWI